MATETYIPTEKLIEYVQDRFTQKDVDLVRRACAFAEIHYAAIRHPTGSLYSEYVLVVAKILFDLGSAPIVIAAAIIHPPTPIYAKVFNYLKAAFEDLEELVWLVEEIFRLSKLEWDVWPNHSESHETQERKEVLLRMFLLAIDEEENEEQERYALAAPQFQKKEKQIENNIRMFLAEVRDVRALIIKLADQLHFMKLLKNLTESEKEAIYCRRLAQLSLTIYAPLADRLGLRQLKSELEDMSFRLLDMEKYKSIANQLAARKQEREKSVKIFYR